MKKPGVKRFIVTLSGAAAAAVLLVSGSAGLCVPNVSAKSSVPVTSNDAKYEKIQAERAAEVVELMNKERIHAGLKKLTVHTELRSLAKDKAVDLYKRHYFSHTSPVYGSPFDMMDAYNIAFIYAGENLAKGQSSAKEVMSDWMKSPGHRKNILNPHYTMIGVGYYNGLWVQEFIGN